MNKDFNKNLLLDNILYLVKEKNLKIGEVEVQAGVSPGYISRNRDGNTKPSIEFIVNISSILNVSIDALTRVDFSAMTPTEKYLVSFIEKLIRDTTDDKLSWDVETKKYLNELETDNNGDVYHSLFQATEFSAHNGDYYPAPFCSTVFPSHSFEMNTTIHGDCFNLRLKNNTYLYLMNVEELKQDENDVTQIATEIWMFSSNTGRQFLCSNRIHTELSCLVDLLYTSVQESSKHPIVKKEVKTVIDAFMKDDIYDDPSPFGPFMVDDDVPF